MKDILFRHSRDRVNVGENIWAAPYSNYSNAIRLWFDEVYDKKCDCKHAYKHCCGHYVQVFLLIIFDNNFCHLNKED